MLHGQQLITASLLAAALLIAGCTTEADDTTNNGGAARTAVPVSFGGLVGTPKMETRAGEYRGIIGSTEQLKSSNCGFGVFTAYTNNQNFAAWVTAAPVVPNFMYNQQVTWNGNQWHYTPTKYWPNETGASAQSQDVDKLSFFAYAPYMEADAATGATEQTTGITNVSTNSSNTTPRITYVVSNNPTQGNDLLWGTDASGLPHVNLTKQAIDENVDFHFRHALARMAITIRAVVDELTPGDIQTDDHTRIEVTDITIAGHFPTTGTLDLNNTTANVAQWTCDTTDAQTLTMTATTPNTLLARLHTVGVNTVERNIFTALPMGTDGMENQEHFLMLPTAGNTAPGYRKTYRVSVTYDVVTTDSRLPAGEHRATTTQQKDVYLNLACNTSYTLRLLLGLTSLKLTVESTAWGDESEVNYSVE